MTRVRDTGQGIVGTHSPGRAAPPASAPPARAPERTTASASPERSSAPPVTGAAAAPEAGASGERPPDALLRSLGYTRATEAQQASLRRLRLNASFVLSAEPAILDLLRSRVWLEGSAADRDALLTLATALPPLALDPTGRALGHGEIIEPGLAALARLCNSGAILAQSCHGVRTLESLVALAAQPLHPDAQKRLGTCTRAEVLSGLLLELADPARIDQQMAGTCTVTSLLYELARSRPADYAELASGLLLNAHATLADGSPLPLAEFGIERTSAHWRSGRTPSERVLQSSLMQSANPDRTYRFLGHFEQGIGIETWTFRDSVFGQLPLGLQILFGILFPIGIVLALIQITVDQAGLAYDRWATVASRLFGITYRMASAGGNERAILERLERELDANRQPRRAIFFAMTNWGSGHAMQLVGVDTHTRPAALIARNPWGSHFFATAGDDVAVVEDNPSVPANVTMADPREGTVRIPLTPENAAGVDVFLFATQPDSASSR